ncbi:MAG: serine/threonine-protein kinase [Myxococcota bacterium]
MPEIGDLVAGRYRILNQLGIGGMGTVFRARQLNLSRDCALKMMHTTHSQKEGARLRFEREARVASQLRHDNAIAIYDFGEDAGRLFLVMELLTGEDLRNRVDVTRPPLDVEDALEIVLDVADALIAAHAIGLVHRDLKPENIFLETDQNGDERAVVVDFGLAFIAGNDGDLGRMTREGVITGTPDYLSPEQARGRSVGPPTDIYSLGVCFYEMLTAFTPFRGDPGVLLSQHMFMDPPPLQQFHPGLELPSIIEELIFRMLKKAPEDRPTAQAVFDTLTSFDPSIPERKGKGRAGGALLGREARMISAPPPPLGELPPLEAEAVAIEVHGKLDHELRLGLLANGIVLEKKSGVGKAILAFGVSPDEVRVLAQGEVPVLVDAPKEEIANLAAYLRAGAADVLLQPVEASVAAAKILRAVQKHSERTRSR